MSTFPIHFPSPYTAQIDSEAVLEPIYDVFPGTYHIGLGSVSQKLPFANLT